MKCEIIRNRENFIKLIIECDTCFKFSIGRKERVIADNLHTKVNSGFSYKSADSTKTDNTKGFASDFRTCKCTLALFNGFAYVVALVLNCFAPVNSLCYLSA